MTDMLDRLIQMIRQGFPCLFHLLTGYYCPGCGGTRAVWYLLHGEIWKSIQYHPLVCYVAVVILVELSRLIYDKAKKRHTGYSKRYETLVWIGVAIILINWGIKNYWLAVKGINLLP